MASDSGKNDGEGATWPPRVQHPFKKGIELETNQKIRLLIMSADGERVTRRIVGMVTSISHSEQKALLLPAHEETYELHKNTVEELVGGYILEYSPQVYIQLVDPDPSN